MRRRYIQFASQRLGCALKAIIALNFFVSRVDAANPAPASTEVQWPAGYSPTKADLFTHDEVVIHASPATVWDYLVAAEQWPRWYSNSHDVTILNSEHVLRPGCRFVWTTFGVRLASTVAEFVPNKRLGWFSTHVDGSGVRSYHAWLLIPVGDGCRLISESTEFGPNISSAAEVIRQGRRFQLKRIKAVAESRQ
ncbi:MAG TPA: SRPBCC family protein [Chthoniobacterales bacterium]